MAVDIQGGPAQPVQTSVLAPSGGPAIPIAVLTDVEANARGVIAGPVQSVVEVTDGRMRLGGAAVPVVVGSGNGFTIAGPPIPVYVVSGSLNPNVPAPVNTVLPAVSGTQAPGATLTTTDGTWTNNPTSYTYQWKRNGVAIGGATNNTYVVQSADIGTTLTVTVTATNAGGSTPATSTGTTISSLHNSLISYWNENEASGNRVDSVIATGNTLTDNNTVTSNPGIIGNAAQFTGLNLEWLSHVSNASLQTGSIDFTIACWVWHDTTTGNAGIATKDDIGANREYGVYQAAANGYRFFVFDSGGSFRQVGAGGAPTTGAWHFVTARHKNGDGLYLQTDNAAPEYLAMVGGCQTLAAPFSVGSSGGITNFFDGRIDEVFFAKRFLSDAECTTLYNGGAGVTWPFAGIP